MGMWAVMAQVSRDMVFILSLARFVKNRLASLFVKLGTNIFFFHLILIQLFPRYDKKWLSACQCLEALQDSLSRKCCRRRTSGPPPFWTKEDVRRSASLLKGTFEWEGQCEKCRVMSGQLAKRSARRRLMRKDVIWLDRMCICKNDWIMLLLSMRK